MKLGFVGLGNMGCPIALNLIRAGHDLTVFDLSAGAVQRLVAAGAIAADSAAAVAEAGEIVLSSLPNPAAVEAVYLGQGGLIEGARPGQLFVDLSSISPSVAKKVASAFAAKDAAMMDAPVSGGVKGATEATLAIMVGGSADAFQRAVPVLNCIGKNVFHVGPVGTSSTIKILNQLLVGINNAAVTEMIVLGRAAGMDLAQVKEVIDASSGWSRILETEFPKAMNRDFDTGFGVDLMAKDLRLARDLGKELGVDLPAVQMAVSHFEQASAAGLGKKDVSSAIQLYEN
ncbi:MAG TPA: NAD(P)-dependent oxidoreductase [Chloroflexota bacterium]|nr:NAD(P)-dependent oxidoreductase [Chloroflexota bacterium]